MRLSDFELERWKASHVLHAKYNLSERGILPVSLREISRNEPLGHILAYGTTEGTEKLREEISELYLDINMAHAQKDKSELCALLLDMFMFINTGGLMK